MVKNNSIDKKEHIRNDTICSEKHFFFIFKNTEWYIVNLKPKFSICKTYDINCSIVSETLYAIFF